MGGGVNTTVLAAFAAGFVSFISPCVLPLVPGYLSTVSGVSVADLQSGERRVLRVLGPSLIFCLTFTIMFVALGMTATGLGATLNDHRALLDRVAGGFIVAMGAFLLAAPVVPRLNREWRPDALIARASSGGPVVAGAAFAFAWTPCVGPTLGAILAAAAGQQGSVGEGGILLAVYSAGLAIPFLITAVAFNKATRAFRWMRDHYLAISAISGLILIAMGLLIFTNELTVLNSHAQDFLSSIGLDGIFNI